jgi:iron complex outermembrane recepter protein
MVANPSDPNGYWIIGAMRSNQFTKSSTASLFTEWTLALAHDFSITGGVGVSNMVIDLNDRFYVANSTKPTRYTNTYDGMVSPHLAVNKVFSKELSVYASYSKGYKAPVSSYFFIPTTGQVNTGLKPEIGDQFEIGTKGSLFEDRLSYSLALFQAKFKDKMTSVAVPLTSTTTAYSYVANGGDQNHKGIEASASFALLRSSTGFIKLLRPFANIAYSDFKYENYQYQKLNATNTGVIVVDYSGLAVAGVPKVATNFGVDLSTKVGLYANLTYSFKDGFPISSDGLYNTSSYNLLNGKVGIARELGKHFSIDGYFGVTNITGVQYPLMVFVNQLPDAYLPAPLNTNYFGGLNLKYIF